jgi:hypothetical protein
MLWTVGYRGLNDYPFWVIQFDCYTTRPVRMIIVSLQSIGKLRNLPRQAPDCDRKARRIPAAVHDRRTSLALTLTRRGER